MSRIAILVALSFLIFSSMVQLAGAQFPYAVNCTLTGQATDMGTCLSYAIPLAGIGILFSLTLVGITFMLGEVIRVSPLTNWYRNELKETVKSLIVIAIVIGTLAIMSGVAASLAGPPNPAVTTAPSSITSNLGGLYDGAINYLNTQFDYANNAFNYFNGLATGIGLIKSLGLSLWSPVPIVIIPPTWPEVWFRFGSSEAVFTSDIMDTSNIWGVNNYAFIRNAFEYLILPMYVLLQMQIDLLPAIMQVGMLILIPIGLVLRAIPFIRGIGGTLIAVGIAVSIIYPTVLIAFNAPISAASFAQPPSQNYTCSSGTWFDSFICDVAQWGYSTGSGFTDGLASFTSIYPAFNGLQDYIYNLSIQFVLFVLDVLIVVILAQNIAKMLGGTIRLGIGHKLQLA